MWGFVELIAITVTTALLVRDVSAVPSASTSPQWRGTYTQSSYWYSDYAVPKPKPKKEYLPTPQFCPETGRSVCAEVKPAYPTDDIFEVIRSAKAKRFNISSEFVDESQNDPEPNFYDPPKPQYEKPPKHEGYVVYQTAVHYDSYGNIPHNYNNERQHYNNPQINYQPLYPPQDYGLHKDNYNNNGNKPQYHSIQNHRNIEQMAYPYASDLAPVAHPKENSADFYPHQDSRQGYNQMFPNNDMISQTHTRYKRQTGTDTNDACPSRMILVEPRAALNDKSQWKYVINLSDRDPRLKQAIRVEVCQSPGQPCSNQVSLPFGFISRCKQKYIKKKLLSLDSSGQSISSENFFSPSCCVCEIVRNNDNK